MAAQIIKTGNNYNSTKYYEVMIDSKEDLNGLDAKEFAPGSIAYTCKTGGMARSEEYMWNGNAWVKMSALSVEGGAGGDVTGEVTVRCVLELAVNDDMELVAKLKQGG